jgi:nitrogen fixation protein FixH
MNYKILVAGVLLCGMLIVAVSIGAAINVRDREVVTNAYEAGLAFDQTRKREAELGWKLTMPDTAGTGNRTVALEVLDRRGLRVDGAAVQLELVRVGAHDGRTYQAENTAGLYVANVFFDKPGCWDVQVQVSRGGDSLRFERRLQIL